MKFNEYINEGAQAEALKDREDILKRLKGGILSKKAMKIKPGKKQFFISATNLKTNKKIDGYIQTSDITNIHGVFGKHGWIINKHYET